MTELDPRLDDTAVQQVLARALDLQRQGATTLTVAQVRQIAADLMIPESAVNQALAEYRAAQSAPVARPSRGAAGAATRGARWMVRALALVGGLVVLALVLRMLFPAP